MIRMEKKYDIRIKMNGQNPLDTVETAMLCI